MTEQNSSFVILPPQRHKSVNGEFEVVKIPVKLKRPEDSHPVNGIGVLGSGAFGYTDHKKTHGLTVDSLFIRFWIDLKGENSGKVDGVRFSYDEIPSIDLKEARAILKTFEKLEKALGDISQVTIADAFKALSKVFGPIQYARPGGNYSAYSDTTWRYLSTDVLLMEVEAIQEQHKITAQVHG